MTTIVNGTTDPKTGRVTTLAAHPLENRERRTAMNSVFRARGIPVKVCAQCRTVKALDAFARYAKAVDGLDSTCRACHSARKTATYVSTPRPPRLKANTGTYSDELQEKPADGWQDYANCLTAKDKDLFFPVGDGRLARATEEAAKRFCDTCWVKAQCLNWAVATRQYTGVWGGLAERERHGMYEEREKSATRCFNAQSWVEAELADGRTQRSIARELRVDPKVLSRAVTKWRSEADEPVASGQELAA